MHKAIAASNGTKLSAILITVIVLSLAALTFGYYGYPVGANNDGAWHVVPAIRYAEVHQLDNPIVWTGDHVAGSGPYLSFMPLFPIFLSFFIFPSLPIPMPAQALLVIAVLNVIVIVFSAGILYKIATMKGRRLDPITTAIICAALFMILRASWSFGGRSETLVRLLFTTGFLLVLESAWSWRLAAALGVLLGLMTATHPFAPVFFFAFVGFAVSLGHDFVKCFRYLTLVAATGVLTFLLAMQLSPYSIGATIGGMSRHAALMGLSPGKHILETFKSSYVVVYSVVGLLVLFFGIRLFLQLLKNKQIASPLVLVLSALTSAVYIASAVMIGRIYYVAPFLLLVFAAFLYYLIYARYSKSVKYLSAFLFILLVAVSLKSLVLFPFFVKDGMTLDTARAYFAEIVRENPGQRVSLGGSQTWTFSEDYSNMIAGDPSAVPGVHNYLFVQEEGETPVLQQDMDSCALKYNFYIAKIPKFFGVTLSPATPGYGFAVYGCHT